MGQNAEWKKRRTVTKHMQNMKNVNWDKALKSKKTSTGKNIECK